MHMTNITYEIGKKNNVVVATEVTSIGDTTATKVTQIQLDKVKLNVDILDADIKHLEKQLQDIEDKITVKNSNKKALSEFI